MFLEKILGNYFENNCLKGFYIREFCFIYGEELYYVENEGENFKWYVLKDLYVFFINDIMREVNVELRLYYFFFVVRICLGLMIKIEGIDCFDIY